MADEHFFPAGDFPSPLAAAPFFGSGPYEPPPPVPLDVAACAAAMAPFGMMLPPWAAELHLPADSSAATNAAGHFDSALSSLVSSPAHAGAGDDAAAIGDLIGRLGSICNTAASASNSCHSTPLSSPPRVSTPSPAAMAFRGYHPGVQAPPPLETAGRLSRVASSKSLGAAAAAAEAAETTSTKAAAGEAGTPAKGAARKRKGKASSSAATAAAANGSPKRPKVAGGDKCDEDDAAGDASEEKKKPELEKDYIHVRARRGQATDSHSLAERVRREKISERMKLLQSLVPGCNKITGKALMLDEIINYVQSLQRQVEFLSMKLATMNPELEEVDAPPQYLPSDKDMMMHHGTAAAMLGYPPHDLSYGGGDPFSVPPATMESCTSTAFHPGAGGGFGWAHDDLQSIVGHEMTNGHDHQQQPSSHRHAFRHGGQQQQQQTAATVASHMKVEQ